MKSKENIAKDLGISRKTLYNYMEQLNITDLNDSNLKVLSDYVSSKNKSKEISKSVLLDEVEQLRLKNAELIKVNETLQKGQAVLLEQIQYYQNSIDNEIHQIKQNITLLLNPPKKEKKSFFEKIFKI